MIYIDNISGITEVYLGNQSISEVYSYQQKVWPPQSQFKWLATYADSHIESAECDSTSAITNGEINLTNLVSVEIGDCVTSIGDWAFKECTSLTSVTIPNSVTSIGGLAFHTCTSLTSVTIPNSVTSIGGLAFHTCISLQSITCLATTPATLGINVFYNTNCPIYVPCQSIEAYKIAWSAYEARIQCVTPPEPSYSGNYFTTEIVGEVSPTTLINFTRPSGITTDLNYSLDGGATWTPYTTYITGFSTGDKIMWKGHVISQTEQNAYGSYGSLNISTAYKVYGNVMSLLYEDDFEDKTTLEYSYIFFHLFSGLEDTLTSIEGLVLPATTLTRSCYKEMFYGCTLLTTVPSDLLPSTTLANNCYQGMFLNCSGLTTAPELPAQTLADWCYSSMFKGCSGLTNAPELLATDLSEASYCYSNMFSGCTSLNEITCYATNLGVNGSTTNWVNGVASNGTFKCPSTTEWESGDSGIPSGWTRVDI